MSSRTLNESYEHEPRAIVVVYQQAAHEKPEHTTKNLELLAETPFFVGRTLEPDGWIKTDGSSPRISSACSNRRSSGRRMRRTGKV